MRSMESLSSRLTARRLTVCLCAALGHDLGVARDAPPIPTGAFVVTNCNDGGPGSLREVAAAIGNDSTIDLRALSCSTITLASGAVNFLVDNVRVYGPGSRRFTIAGNGRDRVFGHGGVGALSISGVTLTGGAVPNSAGGCLYSAGSINLKDVVVSSCRTYAVGDYVVEGGGVYTRNGLYLGDSTITGNSVISASNRAYGGGVFVRGSLDMLRSTISDNAALGYSGNAGGIASLGNVKITYSTISGNAAAVNAGVALFANYATVPLRLYDTTISGNTATAIIGGLGVLAPTYIYGSTIADNHDGGGSIGAGLFAGTGVAIHLHNTIVADNFSGTARDDAGGYAGASLSGSHDLIMASTLPVPPGTLSSDPRLGPLSDNGGSTLTQALLSGSPAIDAGEYGSYGYDQRCDGFTRLAGTTIDIGAYEVQSTGTVHAVTNCDDSGSGSLNDALDDADRGDTIDLTSLSCHTITLGGALRTRGNLALRGPGADRLTIDANHAGRVVHEYGYGTLLISGLTLANGYYASDGVAAGGCIVSNATVVFEASRATGCSVASRQLELSYGGAISARRLELDDSVLDGNQAHSPANALGGAAWAYEAEIRDSTISGNAGTVGGGIYVKAATTIERSTVSSNVANVGGGAFFYGTGEVSDSTFSANSALAYIGGLAAVGDLSLYSSTIALNTGGQGYRLAAGVLADATLRLHSSIVYGNLADGNEPYDVGTTSSHAVIVGSHNLVGAAGVPLPPDTIFSNPRLGPLQGNGGPTSTHALLPGSPAIDAGDNVAALATDQRGTGFDRDIGDAPDIGAFEVQPDGIFEDGFDPD